MVASALYPNQATPERTIRRKYLAGNEAGPLTGAVPAGNLRRLG
jgi:hypothetical protein